MHCSNAFLVAALFALLTPSVVPADTVDTIYVAPDTGTQPNYTLVKTPTGSFLGTAPYGGMAGFGTVFEVTTGGQANRIVSFNGDNGVFPDTGLIAGTDGKYYGVTGGGGKGDRGTAFRVTTAGVIEKLVDFSTVGLAHPKGRLVQGSDGNFYGYCDEANAQSAGVIFKLTPAKTLSVLARFPKSGNSAPKGEFPQGGLVEQADGAFLGVTAAGGANDEGVVFKVTKAGELTNLADFDGATNGSAPTDGPVLGSDGSFYGTAGGGAADAGVVYKVTPQGQFSTVASFAGSGFAAPAGRLVEIAGTFYGVTLFGGTENVGAVFKITPADQTPALTKVADMTIANGSFSYGGLMLGENSVLYGAASLGGGGNTGTIYQCTTAGVLTKVADLSAPNGYDISRGLVVGPNNLMYGAGGFGGALAGGTVFSVTTQGVVTKIADLDRTIHGSGFTAPLALGADQVLYGTTLLNSKLISISTSGTVTALANLSNTFPAANGVIQGSDGAFYGTDGPFGANGKIFRFLSGPDITPLFTFSEDNSLKLSATPRSTLLEAPDGNLWGTTERGGAKGLGTVFRISKTGQYKLVASFDGANGARPVGPLLLGRDGNFYGLASDGGINGTGTVFRVTPDGKLTRRAAFNGFTGAFPNGGLIQGPGGSFYGVGYAGGGAGKFGTLFKVSLDGKITVLQTFDGKTNGAYPHSTLVRGADGNLYGTTYSTIFRVTTVNRSPVAKNDTFTLPAIRKNVVGNDSDPDRDPLEIISVSDPAHGTAEFNDDGTVSYLPDPDFDTNTVTSDSFTYTVSDGLGGTATATITINVPPDLIRASAGVYGGVLALGDSPQGYWLIGMTGPGVFTGALYLGGVKTSIKGVFDAEGKYSETKARKAPLAPLVINLTLDPLENVITGTVAAGDNVYAVALLRKLPIFTSNLPTPRAGRYTVLLRPPGPADSLPGGTGFASMTVSPKGAVAIVGKLGDGTPFAAGSFLSVDDEAPIYAGVYKKDRGYIAGLLHFENRPESDANTVLSWKKPAQPDDALYPAGFDTSLTVVAARYAPTLPVIPIPPFSLLDTTNMDLTFGTNTPIPSSLSANNVFGSTEPNVKVKIIGKTGLFSGTHVSDGRRLSLGGAFYQKQTPLGEGTFRGPTSTGKITIVADNP